MAGWRLRLLALGLSVMFAAVVYAGGSVVAFERLARGFGSLLAQPIESLSASSVSTWRNTAGVSLRARSLALAVAEARADAAAVKDALDDVVKASPTSAVVWQARME